jgi:hypothetical protein
MLSLNSKEEQNRLSGSYRCRKFKFKFQTADRRKNVSPKFTF